MFKDPVRELLGRQPVRDGAVLNLNGGVGRIKLAYPAQCDFVYIFETIAEGGPKGSVGCAESEADVFKNADLFRIRLLAHAEKFIGDMSARIPALPLAQTQVLLLRNNSK